jgi:hypothetical protein
MRVKTTVGTPRCGVRSAQRADPTNRARQAICVISAPKITPNVLGNLNMTFTLWLLSFSGPKRFDMELYALTRFGSFSDEFPSFAQMLFCRKHIPEPNPHYCSAAQFCLREIRAP